MTTNINYIKLSGIIPEKLIGKRLDQGLANMFPEYSRENIKKWILDGSCLINKQKSTPKRKIIGGELITISAKNYIQTLSWEPEKIPLAIVYEDQDLLVLNKPSNLVMYPAIGNNKGTLLNGLLYYYPELKFLPRGGIIHRLDQNTTGLVVISKNLIAFNNLCAQLKNREFIKVYEAIVIGQLISGGKITLPIGRHPANRLKMAVTAKGKESITHYNILKKFKNHTHLKLTIETGRTHQIRVHMKQIHHPILGDKLYGTNYKIASIAYDSIINNFPRQALHAKELGFKHPITKEILYFKTNLPEDLQNLLNALNDLHLNVKQNS